MNRQILQRTVKKALLLSAILLAIPALLFGFDGKVVGVSDGDTIKVLKAGEQVKVRLASIDCPEKGQPYGQKAKKFTADLVAGKIVKVWETDRDRYGRIVGFVFVGGVDVNRELLKAGYAWHYKKYSRDPELAKLEFQARADKRGLWAEPDPVPPWEWRRGKRSNMSTNTQKVSIQTDGPYHGNVNSRVFHRKGCRYYDCKNCTAVFQSREEALGAGFKPCGLCKP